MSEAQIKHDLDSIARQFQIAGRFVSAVPYGSGHINDTFAVVFAREGGRVRYILQRINHNVFKNPTKLMENVERVTAHVRSKLLTLNTDDIDRRTLKLVPNLSGRNWYVDATGNHWRCYYFIEKAATYDQCENPTQAFQAARAFGEFQKHLADLPAPRLHETIPNFHHTRARFDALRTAIERDSANRAADVTREIEFVLKHETMVDVLLQEQRAGNLPERVTHNDTKLNNVMLDDATGEGICVIDLDTVMPGLALYDFGDFCRSACRPTPEDERDLSKVEMRMEMFEALVAGYLKSAGKFLTRCEKDFLSFSAPLITFEIGIRFLCDHLEGDRYFKIHRENHNADRARVQFKMVESFLRNAKQMEAVVRRTGDGDQKLS